MGTAGIMGYFGNRFFIAITLFYAEIEKFTCRKQSHTPLARAATLLVEADYRFNVEQPGCLKPSILVYFSKKEKVGTETSPLLKTGLQCSAGVSYLPAVK